LIAASDSRWRF